jgi:hypothetical protein
VPAEASEGVLVVAPVEVLDVLVPPQPASMIAASITKASLTIERSYRRDVGVPLRPG